MASASFRGGKRLDSVLSLCRVSRWTQILGVLDMSNRTDISINAVVGRVYQIAVAVPLVVRVAQVAVKLVMPIGIA